MGATTVEWTHEEAFDASIGVGVPPSQVKYLPIKYSSNITEVYDSHGRRWYQDEDGTNRYASITTVLGATDTEGKKALSEWRERCGDEMAEAITRKAATNGQRWHDYCEAFLKGKPVWPFLTETKDPGRASAIAHMLNAKVKNVVLSETRMANSVLKVAGRVDLGVQLHDGRNGIIDFKTGKRKKQDSRLVKYCKQATFYADTLTCSTDMTFDVVIVVQLTPEGLYWQESSPNLWRDALVDDVIDFYTNYA